MSDSYNGWTNRETWLVGLWFGDDLEEYINEVKPDVVDARFCEDHIEQLFHDILYEFPNGFFNDLLTGAWARINWYEIANHYQVEEEDD